MATTTTTTAVAAAPRRGAPATEVASAMQGVFGIDHYRGANLAKLRREELLALEGSLASYLDRVKAALRGQDGEAALASLYRPVHPHLSQWAVASPERLLEDGIADFLRSPSLGRLARGAGCEEVADWVYRVPLLRPEICEAILAEAEAHSSWLHELHTGPAERLPADLPEGFWQRTSVLRRMGLGPLEDLLLRFARICSDLLYPTLCSVEDGAGLDWSFGYVISYNASTAPPTAPTVGREPTTPTMTMTPTPTPDPMLEATSSVPAATPSPLLSGRRGLVPHTDDSEVTLNIGLGRAFGGGSVVFHGLRSTDSAAKVSARITPAPGVALLHLGQHLHAVEDVTWGERHALIVWCRSTGYRSAVCPCCILHRRSSCVCDASWN